MGRFNVMTYRPAADSSPNIKVKGVDPEKAVILNRPTERSCPCGCGEEPSGKNREFRMGHDARYRGKLIRAHLAHTPVVVVGHASGFAPATKGWVQESALSFAEVHGWAGYLLAAEEREGERIAAKLAAANDALVEKAMGPQVGTKVLVKIGRWDYTGQVLALFRTPGDPVDPSDRYEVEYVTAKGDTKTKVVTGDKIGELA